MPTNICVFNSTSNLIDITPGAVTFTGTYAAGAPVVLNSQGVIDPTLLQLGITAIAQDNLNPGNLVGIYSVGGVLQAQLAWAIATGTSPSGNTYPISATGFVNATVAIGNLVSVNFVGNFYYSDISSEFSPSNIGGEVYLSTTNEGGVTPTRPSGVGQLVQSVGYVLSYDNTMLPATVGINFITGFQDFGHISGVCQISQGGTGATNPTSAIANIFGSPTINTVFAGASSGSATSPTFRSILPVDLGNAVFGASGSSHSIGVVPNPGAVAGSSRYLCENSTWVNPLASPTFTGTATIPILANTTSMTTPSIAINGGTAIVGQSGTGGTVAMTVSPTFTGTLGAASIVATGSVQGTTLVSTAGVTVGTTITSYNGLSTVGQGTAPILIYSATTPTTPVGATSILASAPAGLYKLNYYSVVTTTGTVNTGTPSFVFNLLYTDASGAQTITAFTNTTYTLGNVNQGGWIIQNQSVNNIQYSITETGGTFTVHPVLALKIVLERLV
jgi:hypothetical protein